MFFPVELAFFDHGVFIATYCPVFVCTAFFFKATLPETNMTYP